MDRRKQILIHESRLLLGNQYAHIHGDDGELDAVVPPVIHIEEVRVTPIAESYNAQKIERITVRLQNKIWQNRETLCGKKNVDPVMVTDVRLAFDAIGYRFESQSSLGATFSTDIAGYIDAENKFAAISEAFPIPVQKFTAAHEIGHAILHEANGLHRERPNEGSLKKDRHRQETEADLFASMFLMPKKLIRREFLKRFATEKFELTDDSRYGLFGTNQQSKSLHRRDLSMALAGASRYHNQSFSPLTDFFGLTRTAVAIRLEQAGLV